MILGDGTLFNKLFGQAQKRIVYFLPKTHAYTFLFSSSLPCHVSVQNELIIEEKPCIALFGSKTSKPAHSDAESGTDVDM